MINYKLIRLTTTERLKEYGVPLHPNLPLVDGRFKRELTDIGKRIVGLYAMLGLAREADPDLLWNWMEENDFLDFLTEKEMNILQQEKFKESDINICSWKQESLFILGWFTNLESEIGFPDSESDLDQMFTKIPPEMSFDEMIASFSPRSEEELILELDFYYCIHAAIKQPDLWKGKNVLEKVKFAAVEERRRSLEWLVASDQNWDNVTLDT
jgi:hypothetical protein